MSPEFIAQLTIALVSLATGTLAYMATRMRDRPQPQAFRTPGSPTDGTTIGEVLQHAIDRIERLEREKADLSEAHAILRTQLSACLRARRNDARAQHPNAGRIGPTEQRKEDNGHGN